METQRRMPICRTMTKQQREWLDSGCCPICGLPKKDWKRRKDWTCCSVDCSKKYQEECWLVWQYWKLKAFERDKYACVKCGEKPICKNCFGEIVPDNSKLIGDHIVPIAIGGEEYELDNVQTLCIKCNKIKTKEDIKKIALYRRQDKHQSKLNNGNDGIPPKPKVLGILPNFI